MMQRIYGTAWFDKKDLKNYLQMREEAKERDHRKLGKEGVDLFMISQEVGQGLPFWLPNGCDHPSWLERYIVDKEIAAGYQHVYTPPIASVELYKTSGHWDHYREDMFPPMDMVMEKSLFFVQWTALTILKSTNTMCILTVNCQSVSLEIGMMHRYEKSGALTGLQRVREMSLNDGHTFVAPEQIEEEFKKTFNWSSMCMKTLTWQITVSVCLTVIPRYHKYFDNDEMWENAQRMLKAAVDDMGVEYYEAEGEAAFYGPKLDIQVKQLLVKKKPSLPSNWTSCSRTLWSSLHRADGEEHRPVMIHRGVISTMERFTAILIENYKDAFPTWLALTK